MIPEHWPYHDPECTDVCCRTEERQHMFSLRGIISDRIRSGEIAAGKIERAPEVPDPKYVRRGEGHSMGKGATTRGGNNKAE